MRRQSRRLHGGYSRRPTRRLAVVGVALAVFTGVLNGGLIWAADPDFSDVPDILGGQRYLLRDDDLIVTTDVFSQYNTYILQTKSLQVANQTGSTVVSNTCSMPFPAPSPRRTRIGRLFSLPNDVIVTLAPTGTATGSGCNGNPNMAYYVSDPQNPAHNSTHPLALSAFWVQTALADFNFDGYADVFTINNQVAFVATAVNPDDPTQGLAAPAGPVLNLGSQYTPFSVPPLPVGCETTSNPSDPAVGDFNGDGNLDVAWLGGQQQDGQPLSVFFATVCPGDVPNTVCAGASPFQIKLSSQSISAGTWGATSAVITAGNYDNNALDAELVLATGQQQDRSCNDSNNPIPSAVAAAYNFDANLTPQKGPNTVALGISPVQDMYAASAKLDWFGETEQAIIGADSSSVLQPVSAAITVISFSDTLTMTATTTQYSSGPYPAIEMLGLAVGRFDPPAPQPGQVSFTPQIAALFQNPVGNDPEGPFIDIYTVNPPTSFTPTLSSRYEMSGQPDPGENSYVQSMVAGDTQGRSLLLGPPQKVTVTGSIQPQVTLGLPPMHIDFIQDVNNLPNGPPAVLNLSTLPSKFYSQYQTQQSGSNQSSNTNTTSYTFATKESAEAKFSYGIPDLASVSVDLKTSAQQTHNNTVATKYNTYSSEAFDVSTQTGFSDLVWFTSKRFNLYVYPVLGQSVCPQSQPNCTDAQKVPLHVEFSGPDQVISGRVDGSQLEWYQPVQEPGNVFSYPWNATLLRNLYTGFNALTADPATIWATDSSGSTVSVTWTQGSGSDVTSGSVSTQSFDISTTVAAGVNIEGFGASASAGFDYNSSSSVSTLNESSSMVGSSTGVKIFKPSFANPADYAYAAATYIFGQQAPSGTVQQIPLNTTVQSTGPLWTAFVADPTDTGDGAGAWWSQAYTKPDVALNHPSRWTWTPPTPTSGDVLAFNTADPADPVLSEFYFMKGLYITPASANGQGSQITQAPAGDSIQLQARVYNYSLVDMPAGAEVHVRFYGQEWDNTTHDFAGPAFVINEVTLDPLPGFNSTSNQGTLPNWTMASTTFDTTSYADTYLIFWVVVWIEQNGQLVPEITGHGLTAIPGATTAPTAVAIEDYSNNVGFYKQPFYVASRRNSQALRATAAAASLAVDGVAISPAQVMQFEKTAVAATLATGDSSLDGILVLFYDGDPEQGGEAFDMEMIPHIRANDVYVTRVKFQPSTCGSHTIFVVAHSIVPEATGTATVEVACPPPGPPVTRFRGRASGVGNDTNTAQVRLTGTASFAGELVLRDTTLTLQALLNEVDGVGELVRGQGGAALLPLTLPARRNSREHTAVFATPVGVQPRVTVQIQQHTRKDLLRFSVQIHGANIPVLPALCAGAPAATTELTTSLTLDDGESAPVVITVKQPWVCGKNRLQTR